MALVGASTRRTRLPWLVLLSRWRVNLGFVGAIVALAAAGHPTPQSVLAWLPLALSGLALRLWARGHLELRSPLAQSGPYAFVRHPLYVGSFVLGLAFTAMMNAPVLAAVYVVAFLVMYVPKAMREEAYLRQRHGRAYADYATRVGAVLPRIASFRTQETAATAFAWRRVIRHREWQTWLGAAAACAALWLRATWLRH